MQWRNSKERWGWITIAIHWLTAITVASLLSSGAWMVALNYQHTWYYRAPMIHKSVGILLTGLTLFRIFWRIAGTSPQAPAAHSPFEKKAAAAVHGFIYLLLFGMFVSGYMIATAAGKPVAVFAWFDLPALLQGFKGQADLAGAMHTVMAFSLGGLALVHALAALKHHLVDKDNTLLRMLGRK